MWCRKTLPLPICKCCAGVTCDKKDNLPAENLGDKLKVHSQQIACIYRRNAVSYEKLMFSYSFSYVTDVLRKVLPAISVLAKFPVVVLLIHEELSEAFMLVRNCIWMFFTMLIELCDRTIGMHNLLLSAALPLLLWITVASEFKIFFYVFAMLLFCFHTLSLTSIRASIWPFFC